jgi:phosphoglycerate dehydrogenase-like enzyme
LVSTGPANAAIDVSAARQLGITVCGTGYVSEPTVEHTWALILAAARNLLVEADSMRSGGWQVSVGTGLHGKTLGVLGLGRVGSRVARIGQAFGMTTIAWSQNLTPQKAAEHGVQAVTKEQLFAQSDVLSIHVALSERTRGLVRAAELQAMKPTAILVNTSRGPVLDEQALIDTLRDKRITAAAIDVFDIEPLPAAHPLRSLPNTVLTGHIAYVTDDLYRTFYQDSVEDIAAFRAGAPIRVMTTRLSRYPSIRFGLPMLRQVSGNPPGKRTFGGACRGFVEASHLPALWAALPPTFCSHIRGHLRRGRPGSRS